MTAPSTAPRRAYDTTAAATELRLGAIVGHETPSQAADAECAACIADPAALGRPPDPQARQLLGFVYAPNEAAAIDAAVLEFGITDEQRRRLMLSRD